MILVLLASANYAEKSGGLKEEEIQKLMLRVGNILSQEIQKAVEEERKEIAQMIEGSMLSKFSSKTPHYLVYNNALADLLAELEKQK